MSKWKEKRHYYNLYAISDGCGNIKLGYSRDIPKRLSSIRTASPHNVKLEWCFPLGECAESEAKFAESRLHRWCKRHHKNREWFGADCMDLVRNFVHEVRQDTFSVEQEEEIIRKTIANKRGSNERVQRRCD